MSRKRKQERNDNAPPRPTVEPEAPPSEADLTALALDRLAKRTHPELFMALQENIPATDTRWLTLFAYAFDEEENISPLLRLQPVSLNPITFDLDGQRGDARWIVDRLVEVFGRFPQRVAAWQARLSYHVVSTLGEERCAALGREGMGEVVGAVEASLASPEHRLPIGTRDAPLALDVDLVKRRVEDELPAALARSRLGAELQRAFPNEDDEHLDQLVTEAVAGLQFQVGPAPEFAVEARVADKPWVPLSSVLDVLKRRLGGGLRVLRTL